MKQQTSFFTLIMTLGLLALGSIAIPAQAQEHKGGCKHKEHMTQMMQQLDLTEEQHEAIHSIKSELKQKKHEQKKAMKSIKHEMHQLVSAEEFDENSVRALAKKKASMVEEMTMNMAKSMHQILQQLTPEQRAKLEELKKAKHKEKHS